MQIRVKLNIVSQEKYQAIENGASIIFVKNIIIWH